MSRGCDLSKPEPRALPLQPSTGGVNDLKIGQPASLHLETKFRSAVPLLRQAN